MPVFCNLLNRTLFMLDIRIQDNLEIIARSIEVILQRITPIIATDPDELSDDEITSLDAKCYEIAFNRGKNQTN